MSITDPLSQPARPPSRRQRVSDDPGLAWTSFAALIIGLLAAMNLIYGIGAISKSSFFVQDAKYVISDLRTWGWVLVLIAVAQGLTAFGVMAEWTGARWVACRNIPTPMRRSPGSTRSCN